MTNQPEEAVKAVTNPVSIKKMVSGNRSQFVVQSKQTGKHHVYRVTKPRNTVNGGSIRFVSVKDVTGDSRFSYKYLGFIVSENGKDKLVRAGKVKVATSDPRSEGFRFVFENAINGMAATVLRSANLYHTGRCFCCGKKLTDPESINLGIGPICRSRV